MEMSCRRLFFMESMDRHLSSVVCAIRRVLQVPLICVLACIFDGAPVVATPMLQAFQDGSEVRQQELRKLISRIEKSVADQQWLQAVEQFNSAWEQVCQNEDPLLTITGTDVNQLAPGKTERQAGGRATLETLFISAPTEFQTEFRNQFETVAEARIADAIAAGDFTALRSLTLRFAYCRAAQNGLRILARRSIDRGDDLEAALMLNRLMRISGPSLSRTSQEEIWLLIAFCNWRAGLSSDAVESLSVLLSMTPQPDAVQRLAIPVSGKSSHIEEWFSRITGIVAMTKAEWTQPGGSYRRFAVQDRTPPRLEPTWISDSFQVYDVLFEERLNPVLQDLRVPLMLDDERQQQQNSIVVPAASPLRVGDLVIFRTPCGVRAVNAGDGNLVWEVIRPDGRIRDLLKALEEQAAETSKVADPNNPEAVAAAARNAQVQAAMQSYIMATSLRHQLVRTNTAAQLSATDTTLFVCDESSGLTSDENFSWMFRDSGRSTSSSNFIRAYDLKTGVFKWEIGGHTQSNSQPKGRGNLLSGFYFLGSPLVLGNRIYVLAESSEGIYLLQIAEPALNGIVPANPRVAGSQLLTVPQFSVVDHPVRKHAGLVPSYANGLLICPTCDERIIAVSAEDKAVRWVFRYAGNIRRQEIGGDGLVLSGGRNILDSGRVDLDSRWTDSLPRIVGNHVLVTPRDSDELFCLDLLTGRERWKLSRNQFHSIAGIADDKIVLCGNRIVQAFLLDNGQPVWTQSIFDGVICGMPATDGNVLQIPTSDPGILSLDIRTGRRLVTQRFLGSGDDTVSSVGNKSPGNLLITGDQVLCQNLDSLRAYTIGKQPLDEVAQATERLLQNDLDGAVTLLESGLKESATRSASRELLIDVLMETLRRDFAANKSAEARVRKLIRESDANRPLESVLHLMLGMSLTDAALLPGQLDRRSQRLLSELGQLSVQGLAGSDATDLTQLADGLRAMLPELIEGQSESVSLGELRRLRSRATVAEIKSALNRKSLSEQKVIQQKLQNAAGDLLESISDQSAQIQYVRDLTACEMPDVAMHVLNLVKPFIENADYALLREQIHFQIVRSGDDDGTAMRSLLEGWLQQQDLLMIDAVRTELTMPDAGHPLSSLRLVTPEAVASKAALESWMSAHPEAAQSVVTSWGMQAKISQSDHRTLLTPQRIPSEVPDKMIPLFGSPGMFRGWSFVILKDEQRVAAYDSVGHIQWQLPVDYSSLTLNENLPLNCYVTSCGHMLLLQLHGTLYSLDTGHLVEQNEGDAVFKSPRVLWTQQLETLSSDPDSAGYRTYVEPADRITQFAPQLAGYFPVGAVTPSAVAVIAGRRLLVFDTVTGRSLWQLEGIAIDAALLMTRDAVCVFSRSGRQIEKRSLIDGTQREVARMPDWWDDANYNVGSSVKDSELEPDDSFPWRIVAHGQSCVLFRLGKSKSSLECRDLMTDKVQWSLDFPGPSVFSNVADDVVAVLSDGKKLTLIRTDTGHVLTTQDVTPVPEPRDLFLVQSLGNYIILPEAVDDPSIDLDPIMEAMHVYGRIYCIDAKTLQLRWDEPVDHRFIRRTSAPERVILPNAPIMVLLNRGGPTDPKSGIRRVRIGAKVIDVRTGKELIYEEDVGITLNDLWMRIDEPKHQLELSFESHIYTLDFQDE